VIVLDTLDVAQPRTRCPTTRKSLLDPDSSTPSSRRVSKSAASFLVCAEAGNPYEKFWDWYESPEWEPDFVAILERFLRPGSVYVDFGAWIGPTVLLAAATADRILCMEPDPLARAELNRNLSLNVDVAAKTTVFGDAIAATDGEVILSSTGEGGDSLSSVVNRRGARTTWKVPAVGILTFLERPDSQRADFLKFDIEGAEYEVIPAMAEHFRERRPSIYVALHPNLLYDKSSTLARLRSGVRILRANSKLLRATRGYKHHYVYDERENALKDVRLQNVLMALMPLPARRFLLIGSCFFTDVDLPRDVLRGN
jgi:FkbM family methyltransferase